jgi:electron transfer flavoprotein alpha subunit
VANVIVVIEEQDAEPRPASIEALGLARRISSRLGATLAAAVILPAPPHYGENDLIARLAAHGADKVLLLIDRHAGDDVRWDTHGPSLSKMVELVPSALILFAATSFGRELAPRLAAKVGAALLTRGWMEVEEDGMRLLEGTEESARRIELFEGELEFPVVATIPGGRYEPAYGDEEAEVEVVYIEDHPIELEKLEDETDPAATARVMHAPGAPPPAAFALAKALGGETRSSAALPEELLEIHLGSPAPDARVIISVGPGADTDPAADFAFLGPLGSSKSMNELAEGLVARLKELA